MNPSYPIIDPLDPTIAQWFRRTKNATTLLSVLSVMFTSFIILKTTHKSNKEYSILQLIVVILGLLNDIDAQLIFDPIFLLPIPCVVRNDPLIPIPGSARWHYVIWVAIVAQQAPAFIACYVHRHQIVLLPNFSWKIRPVMKNILLLTYCLIVETPTINLRAAFVPHYVVDEFAQFMSAEWPNTIRVNMDCTTLELIQPYIQSASILHISSVSIVVMLIIHTLRQLNQPNYLSGKRREFQRTMTYLLILQSMFPVLMQVIPNLAGFAIFVLKLKGSIVWPIIMLVLSTNSFAHSLVLLGTTPIYRRTVVHVLRLSRASKQAVGLSTLHHSQIDSQRNKY